MPPPFGGGIFAFWGWGSLGLRLVGCGGRCGAVVVVHDSQEPCTTPFKTPGLLSTLGSWGSGPRGLGAARDGFRETLQKITISAGRSTNSREFVVVAP